MVLYIPVVCMEAINMSRNKYPEETVALILETSLKLFIEKGYDTTSIQDIIDHLGGLSKGAIYHHFKSKEDIFEAVCQQISDANGAYFDKIRDEKGKTGFEKLRTLIKAAIVNPSNDAVFAMSSKIISDPKFLRNQIIGIYEVVSPIYLEPIIREGISDGSIKTDYPKELSEVIMTLFNIWINPLIAKATPQEMEKKIEFYNILLQGIGIDIFDKEIIDGYIEYAKRYQL